MVRAHLLSISIHNLTINWWGLWAASFFYDYQAIALPEGESFPTSITIPVAKIFERS
tara:strand:- start:193 stop:363 length:171 start_codon:yes stop_codon:yes gene_type:complete